MNAKKIQCKCPVHGSSCSVASYYEVFIIYLHLALDDEEEDKAGKEPPSLLPLEDNVEDVEEELDGLAERNLAESFDFEAARRDSIIPVSMSPTDEDELGDLPVPIPPMFIINGKKYVLMTDIQHVFYLREDYCLAIIAQSLEDNDGFIDLEFDQDYFGIDSNVSDTDFHPALEIIAKMFRDAEEYERNLPIEEEFLARQSRLNLSRRASVQERPSGSIDVWEKSLLVSDENQKVYSIFLM